MVAYGPPGIGKTEFGAQLPGCVFLIDSREDGINTLKSSGRGVRADIPVFPAAKTWADVLGILDSLIAEDHKHKAIVVDALGGIERLCHEEVCRREYNNVWGEKGFGGYKRGYETSLTDWQEFINKLDILRNERRMSVLLLGHSKIAPFKNPAGDDFDRYCLDIHHKTWAITHKWVDVVLFMNYDIVTTEDGSRVKGRGGSRRVMHTEYDAAWDAKNRFGLPTEIDMGSCGADAWANFTNAIKAAKEPVNG